MNVWSCLEIVKDPFAAYMAGNSMNKLIFPFVDPRIKALDPAVLKFALNEPFGELNISLHYNLVDDLRPG